MIIIKKWLFRKCKEKRNVDYEKKFSLTFSAKVATDFYKNMKEKNKKNQLKLKKRKKY